MGREQAILHVYGSLSRHNSPQDAEDNAAWAAFAGEVRRLAALPRFATLELVVDGNADPDDEGPPPDGDQVAQRALESIESLLAGPHPADLMVRLVYHEYGMYHGSLADLDTRGLWPGFPSSQTAGVAHNMLARIHRIHGEYLDDAFTAEAAVRAFKTCLRAYHDRLAELDEEP